ncbi:reverse transcriptase domain-containing protein [Tanacetum coccineum]
MHTIMVPVQVKTMKFKLEYKFQDQEDSEDIFSFGSALEDFICVVFVLDRNIVSNSICLRKKYRLNLKNDMPPRDKCVDRDEAAQILRQCHNDPSGGHHGIATTARKVFEVGFYWPNIFCDACRLVRACDACQRARNISSRDETPQKYIQVCKIFDVWGNFMGLFPSSNGNKYVLVAIDNVLKWVESQAFPASDARRSELPQKIIRKIWNTKGFD